MLTQSIAALVLSVATLTGCNYDGKAEAKRADLEQTWAGKARPQYIEFVYNNRTYVVGSEKTRDKIMGGGKMGQQVVAFGGGPNGETVVFEQDKNRMEEILMGEYEKRHGVKVQ